MNKTERLKALLERGYFPRELPPPFHTNDLAKYRAYAGTQWDAVANNYPNYQAEIYSNPRIQKLRRNLAIVNPVAQFYLAKLIADNWVEIRKSLRTSDYSIEIPEIAADTERAVPLPDFGFVALRRIEISAAYDHALLSDISRFYGTLYTHGITWALHGKSWSKQNLHTPVFNASLGNKIDIAVRKCQENQTIGIPVGPDTSRIISEIVGVSIDQYVQKALKLDRDRAFRHVDDWYIGFDNAGDAENAIAILATACRTFELELNAEKTRTHHASSDVENVWPTELREQQFKRTVKGQSKSLEHFFVKAFQFSRQFQNQNVLSFSLKTSMSIHVHKENWRMYESFILKAARSNATVIPIVVQILTSYNHNGFDLDRGRITKLIDDLIIKNAPLAHHAEVSWALFLAKALKIQISKAAATAVSGLESAVCALLALDIRGNGLIEGPLDTSLWEQSMSDQGLSSNMWLLAYEADLKGWLKGNPIDFVDQNQYFSVLKKKRISFYDKDKNVLHIKKQKPRPLSAAHVEFLKNFNIPQSSEPYMYWAPQFGFNY